MMVAMPSTVTAPVIPVVSTSSSISMAALLDGDETAPPERGQQECNDNYSHAFLHGSLLSLFLRVIAAVHMLTGNGLDANLVDGRSNTL